MERKRSMNAAGDTIARRSFTCGAQSARDKVNAATEGGLLYVVRELCKVEKKAYMVAPGDDREFGS